MHSCQTLNNFSCVNRFTANRKRFKKPRYPAVDEALYVWFLQKRQLNVPVSHEMLQVQAQKFYSQMIGEGEYGSRGYVDKFIKRHDIRLLKITGEKLSSNLAVIDQYVVDFSQEMRCRNLQPYQIFNADESGLYFKAISSTTYVDRNSASAPGRKVNKERITFMPCSNMDGSLKLPLMLIGKYKNPRPLKNLKDLPVYYRASKNAWMTRELFKNWFFEQFVPLVTDFLKGLSHPVKAVLVLDNCSAHYSTEELRTDDGAIFCKFLPPNTTAVIQPMDQHVIQMVKARYKKIMTNEILGRGDDFHDNVKRINIKDAMFWIAQAWEAVPESAIQKSWKILYTETPGDDEDDLPLSVLQERLRNIMNNINQLETIDEENAEFEILKDDEIVEKILNPSVDDFSYTTNQDHEDSQHLSTSVDPEDENVNVSDEAALNGADVLLRYAEEQGWSLNTQFSLRKMREDILNNIVTRKT